MKHSRHAPPGCASSLPPPTLLLLPAHRWESGWNWINRQWDTFGKSVLRNATFCIFGRFVPRRTIHPLHAQNRYGTLLPKKFYGSHTNVVPMWWCVVCVCCVTTCVLNLLMGLTCSVCSLQSVQSVLQSVLQSVVQSGSLSMGVMGLTSLGCFLSCRLSANLNLPYPRIIRVRRPS